ncbi:MAG: saccharopine dehydrogenase, partial [Proteobacteria bacterium]|nr:saccharopine dehydrogenase [Pseudomonadota bacterium]
EFFVSWCGGIPAPDDNNNPLGYKFSWEPRGAIMALDNDAAYQHHDKIIKINGEDLMFRSKPITIAGLKLECYPNRESTSYKSIYGIENIKDIIRGTLRYQGFCHIMQSFKDLGLMETQSDGVSERISWKNYILKLNNAANLTKIQTSVSPKTWDAMKWVGCFSDEIMAAKKDCSIDVLCDLFLKKLSYKTQEKDMVVLQHKFVIKKPDGSRYFISSVLKEIGDSNGYSAMAKTVGYPIAMAAQLIADGKILAKGLLLPVAREIYQPLLKYLKSEGIEFNETHLTDKETSAVEFLKELN